MAPLALTHPLWDFGSRHQDVLNGRVAVTRQGVTAFNGHGYVKVNLDPWLDITWSAWPTGNRKVNYGPLFSADCRVQFSTIRPGRGRVPSTNRSVTMTDERFSKPDVLGDPTGVDEIRFLILNGPDAPLDSLTVDAPRIGDVGRMVIEHGPWRITLDRHPNRKGFAYNVTHVGSLQRRSGAAFGFEAGRRLLERLANGLSFIRGGMAGLFLPTGLASGMTRCVAVYRPQVDSLERRPLTWFHPTIPTTDIDSLLRSILSLNDKDVHDRVTGFALLYAIRAFETPIEIGMTQAMAGLEYLVDHEIKPVWQAANPGKNWIKEPAFNKIGDLGDVYGLPHRNGSVATIRRYQAKNGITPSGKAMTDRAKFLEPVTWARNKHIHPDSKARDEYPHRVWWEAYSVSTEWITLAVLHRLGYTGSYTTWGGRRPTWEVKLRRLKAHTSSARSSRSVP